MSFADIDFEHFVPFVDNGASDDFPSFMDNSTPPPTSINFNDHYPAAPPAPSPTSSSSSGEDAATFRDLHRSLRSAGSSTGSDMPSLQTSSPRIH